MTIIVELPDALAAAVQELSEHNPDFVQDVLDRRIRQLGAMDWAGAWIDQRPAVRAYIRQEG